MIRIWVQCLPVSFLFRQHTDMLVNSQLPYLREWYTCYLNVLTEL